MRSGRPPLAERVGFEPTIRYDRIPDLQSGAFVHSATSPEHRALYAPGGSICGGSSRQEPLFRLGNPSSTSPSGTSRLPKVCGVSNPSGATSGSEIRAFWYICGFSHGGLPPPNRPQPCSRSARAASSPWRNPASRRDRRDARLARREERAYPAYASDEQRSPSGMDRRSNAAGLSPRAAGPGPRIMTAGPPGSWPPPPGPDGARRAR